MTTPSMVRSILFVAESAILVSNNTYIELAMQLLWFGAPVWNIIHSPVLQLIQFLLSLPSLLM